MRPEFLLKKILAQMFSCGFFEISKNTFLTEHLWATASVNCGRPGYAFDICEHDITT